MTALPLPFRWSGAVMVPLAGRATREADTAFLADHVYCLVEEHSRSMQSHRHEFAWLHEAWQNLPEEIADLYPTAEHLRKAALIKAGFHTEQIIDAGSKAAALRVASGIRSREEFSVIIVRGRYVRILDAVSQSLPAMGADDFNASKTAILEIVSAMIGVTPDALINNKAA